MFQGSQKKWCIRHLLTASKLFCLLCKGGNEFICECQLVVDAVLLIPVRDVLQACLLYTSDAADD